MGENLPCYLPPMCNSQRSVEVGLCIGKDILRNGTARCTRTFENFGLLLVRSYYVSYILYFVTMFYFQVMISSTN
jgi:hypothetical protein